MVPAFKPVYPEELMSNEEYISAALTVNDISIRSIVNDKYRAAQRLSAYMGRKSLRMAGASREDIISFLASCGRVVGKINDSDGRRFKIYDVKELGSVETIIADAPDVLEEYIIQHPAYSAIYDKSINTLRIHTVRTRKGVQIFFKPILSIGARGSISDHPICDKALRILLEEDGTVISGVDRWHPYNVMETHPDTGYRVVPGTRLPFVKEACDICKEAALLLPELRYIGWDVAITPDGPLVVEPNSISGLAPKYNSRQAINEMVAYAREGISTCGNTLFQGRSFAKELTALPDEEDMFLILLQTDLHIFGVEFSTYAEYAQKIERVVDCDFSLNDMGSELSVSADGKKQTFELPVFTKAAGHIFELDKLAWDLAEKIYRVLEEQF